MKTTFAILILSASLLGCTTTHSIAWEEPSSLHTLNAQAKKQTAEVTLADGRQVRAANLHMAADSTLWFDQRSGAMVTMATGNVVEVAFTSPDRGALEAIIGGAIGAGVAAASWSPCQSTGIILSCFMHPNSRGEATALGALGGSIAGLVVGKVLGSAGSKTMYRIETPPAPAGLGRRDRDYE